MLRLIQLLRVDFFDDRGEVQFGRFLAIYLEVFVAAERARATRGREGLINFITMFVNSFQFIFDG